MHRLSLLTVCCWALGLLAQAPGPEAQEKKPGQAAAAEAKKAEPPKEKPFAEIVKEAQVIPGLFTLYRTEEKVFLELRPDQLDKIYMLSVTCDSGIGERGFYAAAMCGETPVSFHKAGKQIQLLARNTMFAAQEGTPMRRAVGRSFSDSILGSARTESLPHPERKSVLIDLGSVLLADVPMFSYSLEATFRIPYRFDAKSSVFGAIKGFEKNVEVETVAHYAVERPPVPPLPAPGATPPPMPPPPRNLMDVRSMMFHFRYSFAELPQSAGYRPRLADDRVGHFFEQIDDYTSDVEYTPTRRLVRRWHLEKADPQAALSRPKKPIVYWLENTVPVPYRDAIREGILMWNKAFERIGFKDAIEVRQQPDDPDWDPADIRYSTVRWFAGTDAAFAQGPSRANPFTGEIYDADIRFSETMTRLRRREAREEITPLSAWEPEPARPLLAPWSVRGQEQFCDFAAAAARDAEFSFDVLLARGMDPEGPEADKFVKDWLREVAAHEVGHTLGLRHNFRASTVYTLEQLQDPNLTAREGLTGSVMDYIPTNIAPQGAKQGEYQQSTPGPYDYWAIEYGYKPINAATPEAEVPELRKIAARAAEPALAFATDEDAGVSMIPYDMDPTVNRGDLGSDPLAFYAHRLKLSKEIFANMEAKLEKPGEGYQVLRRSFASALSQTSYLQMAAKYIGGIYHYRDHVGDPGGRLPFQAVPPAKQREALRLVRENLFAPHAFQFPPRLLSKLNNERFTDFRNFQSRLTRFDLPVHSIVLSMQKAALDRLYHPVVLSRVLDSEVLASGQAFRLSEVFAGIQNAVWAETKTPGQSLDINSFRRSLQREYLRKLIGLVLREAAAPEDARSLARHHLAILRSQLQGALARPGLKMPLETRAHLGESLARIDETLKANAQRASF